MISNVMLADSDGNYTPTLSTTCSTINQSPIATITPFHYKYSVSVLMSTDITVYNYSHSQALPVCHKVLLL